MLDRNKCRDDMEQYYLGFILGEVHFIRRTPTGGMPYPGHAELVDWAKEVSSAAPLQCHACPSPRFPTAAQELTLFCFAFLEENEEIVRIYIRPLARLF